MLERVDLAAPVETPLVLFSHVHQFLDGIVATGAVRQRQRVAGKRDSINIVHTRETSFKVVDGIRGGGVLTGLHERDGNIGRERILALESAKHLLVMDESNLVKRTIAVLMTDNPLPGFAEHGLIDVNDVVRLGEGLQDESGQPQAALVVALTERGEAAVVPAVRQLTLIAGYHQLLSLGKDLGFELATLLEVAGYVDIRREEHHILLATAEGHLNKLLKAFHRLSEEAGRERQEGTTGALDGHWRNHAVD